MLHEGRSVPLSPSKGKAREETRWRTGWWDFVPLAESQKYVARTFDPNAAYFESKAFDLVRSICHFLCSPNATGSDRPSFRILQAVLYPATPRD